MAEAESLLQDDRPNEALPATVAEVFAWALEDAQVAGEPVVDKAAAIVDGKLIKAKIFGYEATGQMLVITPEPESTEDTTPSDDNALAKKPVHKGKKGAAAIGESK